MPIKVTDQRTKEVRIEHDGNVIDVRTFKEQRNVSDTLDYTDYQTVEVTEALVYMGRIGKKYDYNVNREVEYELAVEERFKWIDCSNLFVWRGCDHKEPIVDESRRWMLGHGLEDYQAWVKYHKDAAEQKAEQARKRAEKERAEREEAELNRPVKGKEMVVFKGRKVPVGTTGVVAYVSDNGGVLLKPKESWQDRNVNGIWVDAKNLKAVVKTPKQK